MDGIFITELQPSGAGPRLAVKDLFDTVGIRTTYGSAIFREHVPNSTAAAVERLEAAGYANVGKANLHEFAWGITSENEHFGWVPNPIAPGRIAGGSSGGCAAALAAGLADAALGTDSGGSIRIPAACCGIVGFKPTYGLVPLDGCFPLAPSYDHAGPMARDVVTCEQMMAALVPGFASTTVTLADLAIGVAWTEHADPLVRTRVEEAAARLPHTRHVDVPLSPPAAYPGFQREAAEVHESLWREHRELYGENVASKLESALQVTDTQVAEAERARERYREQFAAAMDGLDLLLTPTLTTVAPRAGIGDLALREFMLRLTLPCNTVGAPALALPCGEAEDGLPASLQLIGPPGADALVLAAGRAVTESSRDVPPRRSPARGRRSERD
ncbi:MAG: aspartyl-tRNA(Asn)/glutamyl-tRNA(Gln) amidotransferase subunit [Thermoleophilaceae bacterium]|nr:aspartyl-tRNA(Asn)/glutamyl-tRNA(Gln) amidotransferase subunit [Thermoleophilaceae bacterium]